MFLRFFYLLLSESRVWVGQGGWVGSGWWVVVVHVRVLGASAGSPGGSWGPERRVVT